MALMPVAARLLLAVAVCFLAFQWLATGMHAHAAGTGPADSHAQPDLSPDNSPYGPQSLRAGESDCSAVHVCSCAALPGPLLMSVVSVSTGRLPEPRVHFADYFPGRTLPPPLAVPA